MDKWVAQQPNIQKIEDMQIGGVPAKKAWKNQEMGTVLTVYFISGAKSITFTAFPYNTQRVAEFDGLVKSFRLISQ